MSSHVTPAILHQECFWLLPCQDPSTSPQKAHHSLSPCELALISPGAVPKAITDQETKRIHFIVYKTRVPVGRNTIITLTAANGVGVGGKSSFQILENHSVKMELLGTWVLDLNPVTIPSPPTFLISSLVFLISHSPECRGYISRRWVREPR